MKQRKTMTRRGFAKGSLMLSTAMLAAPLIRPSWAYAGSHLAEGKIGGPSGFEGAESYQYGPDSPEGRAMEGLRNMANKPSTIKLALSEGSIGQLTAPFPEGAPSIKALFEQESGIKLDIIGVPEGQGFTKTVQDVSTKGGNYDIYSVEFNRLGDLVETGGVVPLDEYVANYKPDWDADNGYVGGEQGVQLINAYRGNIYGVALDGDYQTYVYRTDLFNDEGEKKAFMDQYGRALEIPKTFAELDEVAAFFHRPDQKLYGLTDLRNQGWGYTNWYMRYVTTGNPNRFLFDNDGNLPGADEMQPPLIVKRSLR